VSSYVGLSFSVTDGGEKSITTAPRSIHAMVAPGLIDSPGQDLPRQRADACRIVDGDIRLRDVDMRYEVNEMIAMKDRIES